MRKRLKGRVENGIVFLITSILAVSFRVVYETTHLLSGKNVLQLHLDQFPHQSQLNTTTVALQSQVLHNVLFPSLYPDSVDPFYTIPSDGTNLWDHPPTSQLLPDWMKAYFNWHKHQRQIIMTKDDDDVTKWESARWLVLQCLAGQDPQRCGGTADRLVRRPMTTCGWSAGWLAMWQNNQKILILALLVPFFLCGTRNLFPFY